MGWASTGAYPACYARLADRCRVAEARRRARAVRILPACQAQRDTPGHRLPTVHARRMGHHASALPAPASHPMRWVCAARGDLGVLSGQVGDAAGWWLAVERGVSAVMVVDVEPGVKGSAALGFGGVGAGVGPLVGEGAVVALGLAVGLRPVGAGALGGDA